MPDQVDRDRAREHDHSALARVVGGGLGDGYDPHFRAHGDDRAAALRPHLRGGVLHQREHAFQVGVDDRVPLLLAQLGDGHHAGDAGTAEQDVQAPEPIHGGLHHRRRVLHRPDVARDAEHLAPSGAQIFHGPAERVGVDIGDHDLRALVQEELGRGPPDAGGTTGDQRHPALNPARPTCHDPSSLRRARPSAPSLPATPEP